MSPPHLLTCLMVLGTAGPAFGQDRPFRTADPEPLGHRRLAIEMGAEGGPGVAYPLSGLAGDLARATLTFRLGLGGIGEFQVGGGYDVVLIDERRPAPFADLVEVDGDWTNDIVDPVVGVKIRLQREAGAWPATGLRVATRLPSAGNESGLGSDAIDFHYWVLAGKTLGRVRLTGNVGLGVLSDPQHGERQNDVLLYGLAASRPVGAWTVGAEVFGRVDPKHTPPPGTEDAGQLRLGARWARGRVALDGALLVGLHAPDPDVGATFGLTWIREDVLSDAPAR